MRHSENSPDDIAAELLWIELALRRRHANLAEWLSLKSDDDWLLRGFLNNTNSLFRMLLGNLGIAAPAGHDTYDALVSRIAAFHGCFDIGQGYRCRDWENAHTIFGDALAAVRTTLEALKLVSQPVSLSQRIRDSDVTSVTLIHRSTNLTRHILTADATGHVKRGTVSVRPELSRCEGAVADDALWQQVVAILDPSWLSSSWRYQSRLMKDCVSTLLIVGSRAPMRAVRLCEFTGKGHSEGIPHSAKRLMSLIASAGTELRWNAVDSWYLGQATI